MRRLSKTRFKKAWDCPRKLFYSGKPTDYPDSSLDDEFLKALARGGFQIGALAQLRYPDGIEITTLDSDQALRETEELMKRDRVVIFEAAIAHGRLLARVDVLVKDGSRVDLIEVKAKSFDATDDDKSIFTQQAPRRIRPVWEPYFADIAFQSLVFRRAYPALQMTPYLLLADKNAQASRDQLHQQFFIDQDPETKRTRVTFTKPASDLDPGTSLLTPIPAQEAVDWLFAHKDLEAQIDRFGEAYALDRALPPKTGKDCGACEFRPGAGFTRCWQEAHRLSPDDLARHPIVFDVGNLRSADKLLARGIFFMKDIPEKDILGSNPAQASENQRRQWTQIEKVRDQDETPAINRAGLGLALATHRWPLHMIDFETTQVAIPFFKGMHPYETLAFQFSHHVVRRDGRVEHRTQYLNRVPGKFPNFEFVRELKRALSGDEGTIFRYHNHENTVLRQIRGQLARSSEPDRAELIAWIDTVTVGGARAMVDLCALAKSSFYHPAMEGSWSLKAVLPAILQEPGVVQTKYSKPVYSGMNFTNMTWVQRDEHGRVLDPYSLLDPIFGRELDQKLDGLAEEEQEGLRDGGAAMTAYAKMQFTQMSDDERERYAKALLRYCELDTLAMVFLYEYWQSASAIHE